MALDLPRRGLSDIHPPQGVNPLDIAALPDPLPASAGISIIERADHGIGATR